MSPGGTGDDERWGKRNDTSEHYTYIHDPDGNRIELVYHPLGLVDADGNKVEVPTPAGCVGASYPRLKSDLDTAETLQC